MKGKNKKISDNKHTTNKKRGRHLDQDISNVLRVSPFKGSSVIVDPSNPRVFFRANQSKLHWDVHRS